MLSSKKRVQSASQTPRINHHEEMFSAKVLYEKKEKGKRPLSKRTKSNLSENNLKIYSK